MITYSLKYLMFFNKYVKYQITFSFSRILLRLLFFYDNSLILNTFLNINFNIILLRINFITISFFTFLMRI